MVRFVTFFYLTFFKCIFDILFTEIQVSFINFPIPYFLAKKMVHLLHRKHSTAYRSKSQINVTGYHNTIQYFEPPTGTIILSHQFHR